LLPRDVEVTRLHRSKDGLRRFGQVCEGYRMGWRARFESMLPQIWQTMPGLTRLGTDAAGMAAATVSLSKIESTIAADRRSGVAEPQGRGEVAAHRRAKCPPAPHSACNRSAVGTLG
jgi:hypothetical protein